MSFDYTCLRCKKNKTKIFSLPCDTCIESPEYQKEIKAINKKWKSTKKVHKFYREVTAYGHDTKTGRPYWLDKKGKRIAHDSTDVRYDIAKDPHGWAKTDKIPTKKTYHI